MILDGKKTADNLIKKVAEDVSSIEDEITLTLILVGEDPASLTYVNNKKKACDEVGIKVDSHYLRENVTQKEVLSIIEEANNNDNVHGILVQLPLPSHLDEDIIINSINPLKDIDGLTLENQGRLYTNLEALHPATPKGIMTLLQKYFIEISGKHVVVVGRSKLVGKPIAMLLLQKNATVTIAHSRTQNLKEVTKKADILVVAVGKPEFITADMVKKDAVVIDVGINRVEGKLVGDVDYQEVKKVSSYITPVPKGIGPMTIASLLENVVQSYRMLKKLKL